MRLSIATSKAVRYACLNFHYAKSVPISKYAFNIFNNEDEWCGVIIYGSGANNHFVFDKKLRKKYLKESKPYPKKIVS